MCGAGSAVERLVESGKASPELVAAYAEVQALRRAALDGGELPTTAPEFVKRHKQNLKRAQTRERVRRHREKKRNAKSADSAGKCVTREQGRPAACGTGKGGAE